MKESERCRQILTNCEPYKAPLWKVEVIKNGDEYCVSMHNAYGWFGGIVYGEHRHAINHMIILAQDYNLTERFEHNGKDFCVNLFGYR